MHVPANFMATLLFSFWIAFNMYNTNTNKRKWVEPSKHVGYSVPLGSFKWTIAFVKHV